MRSNVNRLVAVVVGVAVASSAAGQDAKPVTQKIKADDGVEILCQSRGKGDTALLFLHGWGGDRSYWKNQVDVFAKDYRVVAIDQAGHGESGKGRKAWSIDSLGADAGAVVKALGLKRVVLIGHSMGGPVALIAAKRLPGVAVGVVGVDTLQNAEFKRPAEMLKPFFDGMEKDFKGTTRGTFGSFLGEKADPELKTWLTEKAAGQEPAALVPLMRDLFAADTAKLFKEAGVPVRCINSGGGFAFYQPTDAAVNKKYADFAVVTMADVGHYPMLEKPAEFNQKLRDVLKEFAAKK